MEKENLFPHKYVYWKLNTERPRFLVQMWKIGMSDFMIQQFDRVFDKNSKKDIYIFYRGEDLSNDKEYLNWHWRENGSHADFLNYKFLGSVNLTPKDIEEYEFDQEAKKYNL